MAELASLLSKDYEVGMLLSSRLLLTDTQETFHVSTHYPPTIQSQREIPQSFHERLSLLEKEQSAMAFLLTSPTRHGSTFVTSPITTQSQSTPSSGVDLSEVLKRLAQVKLELKMSRRRAPTRQVRHYRDIPPPPNSPYLPEAYPEPNWNQPTNSRYTPYPQYPQSDTTGNPHFQPSTTTVANPRQNNPPVHRTQVVHNSAAMNNQSQVGFPNERGNASRRPPVQQFASPFPTITCYRCGRLGHYANSPECPGTPTTSSRLPANSAPPPTK
jgi:hypothetical protein